MKGSWRSGGGASDRDQQGGGSWRDRGQQGGRDDRDSWRTPARQDDRDSFRSRDDRFKRDDDRDDSSKASRPWRPSRARNDDGPPGGRSERPKETKSPGGAEADDEWTTVSNRR